jgi:hypothetical protein
MKRRYLWIAWAISGALYQAAKPIVGLTPHWDVHFDMMYWTGFAFTAMWLIERYHPSAKR